MADAESLMTGMRGRAEALRSLGYRVRFDLTDTEESIMVDATGGGTPAIAVSSADEAADTVLRLTAANAEKLMQGKLSPMLAFSTGRLRVEGSKGVAMKLASLLDDD
jgi:putative sterol carrier protein